MIAHTVISDVHQDIPSTRSMVSDVHCTTEESQGDTGGTHLSVGVTHAIPTA